MRAKPPPTTFSSKALSFYNDADRTKDTNNILIQSADRVNFATHDQNLTTNREQVSKEDEGKSRTDALRTTASGAMLSNLIVSLKDQANDQYRERP